MNVMRAKIYFSTTVGTQKLSEIKWRDQKLYFNLCFFSTEFQ